MDPMEAKRNELQTLHNELEAFQNKVSGGHKPDQTEAEAMDAKAEEALAIQTELDNHTRQSEKLQRTLNWKPAQSTLPPPDDVVKSRPEEIVGFMRIGEYVVAQGQLLG